MRIGQEPFNDALRDFAQLRYSTQRASLIESFLTARWMATHGRYPDPTVADANDAVDALFNVDPTKRHGRLYPFRYDWRVAQDSGRKTVWNNTTRGPKLATSIFVDQDIRSGLIASAADVVANELSDTARPSKQALAVLLLRNHDFPAGSDWNTAIAELRNLLGITDAELDAVCDDRPLGHDLLGDAEWTPDGIPDSLAPPTTRSSKEPSTSKDRPGAEMRATEILIDQRLERMLLGALRTFPCVLLVGPPGTGKGALMQWAIDRIRADPEAFGFEPQYDPNPIWRTPDESWTAFDLIGGLAPDAQGRLKWSNGVLLDSVSNHRWLVLDELNRADLDRIMGPLLTWLAGQAIHLGNADPHNISPLTLGWADGPTSQMDVGGDESSTYLAGRDWRMLGSYNPQDAQRVFAMGQALSRRFVTVPVPPLPPGQFETLLADRMPDLNEDLHARLIGIYEAHYSDRDTLLGPAVFLRAAEYLISTGSDDTEEALAEAYVLSAGKFLGGYDDLTFESLGARVVEEEQALSTEQWIWISTQRAILA